MLIFARKSNKQQILFMNMKSQQCKGRKIKSLNNHLLQDNQTIQHNIAQVPKVQFARTNGKKMEVTMGTKNRNISSHGFFSRTKSQTNKEESQGTPLLKRVQSQPAQKMGQENYDKKQQTEAEVQNIERTDYAIEEESSPIRDGHLQNQISSRNQQQYTKQMNSDRQEIEEVRTPEDNQSQVNLLSEQMDILKEGIIKFIKKMSECIDSPTLASFYSELSQTYVETKIFTKNLRLTQEKIYSRFKNNKKYFSDKLSSLEGTVTLLNKAIEEKDQQIKLQQKYLSQLKQIENELYIQYEKNFDLSQQLKVKQDSIKFLNKEIKAYKQTVERKNRDIKDEQTKNKNAWEKIKLLQSGQIRNSITTQFTYFRSQLQSNYKEIKNNMAQRHKEEIQNIQQENSSFINKLKEAHKSQKKQITQNFNDKIFQAVTQINQLKQQFKTSQEKNNSLNQQFYPFLKWSEELKQIFNKRQKDDHKYRQSLESALSKKNSQFLQLAALAAELKNQIAELTNQNHTVQEQSSTKSMEIAQMINIISKLQADIDSHIKDKQSIRKTLQQRIDKNHQETKKDLKYYQTQYERIVSVLNSSYQQQIDDMKQEHATEVTKLNHQIISFEDLLQMQESVLQITQNCSKNTISSLQAKIKKITDKSTKDMKRSQQNINSLQNENDILINQKMELLKAKQLLQIELEAQKKRCEKNNKTISEFFDNLGKKSLGQLLSFCEHGFSSTDNKLVMMMRLLRTDISELEAKLDECLQVNKDQFEQLEKLKSQVSRYEAHQQKLQQQNSSSFDQIQQWQNDCLRLEGQLEESKKGKQAVDKSLDQKTKEYESVCQDLKFKTNDIQFLQNKIRQLEQFSNNMTTRFGEKQQEVNGLKSQMEKIQTEKDELEERIRESKMTGDQKSQQAKQVRQQLSQEKNNLEIIKSQLKAKEQEYQSLTDQNFNLRKEVNDLKAQLEKSQKENKQTPKSEQNYNGLIYKINNLEKQLSAAQKQIKILEQKLRSQKQSQHRIDTTPAGDLQEQIQLNEMQIQTLKQEKKHLTQQVQLLETKLKLKQNQLQSPKAMNISNSQRLQMKSLVFEPIEQDFSQGKYFSGQSELDGYPKEKLFIVESIEKRVEKKIRSTHLIFSMNKASKFRNFSFLINKTSIQSDENYVYSFIFKRSTGQMNVLSIPVFKNKDMKSRVAFMIACGRQEVYMKKQNTKNDPYLFDFTGNQVFLGSTLKLKAGQNILKVATKDSPYFEGPSMSSILEKEGAAIELEGMDIHRLVLEL